MRAWIALPVLMLALPIRGASAEGRAPFAIRGTLPWHNFLSGPSAWNEADYRAYLDDMAARGLNFVAFHCYTGGSERYAPYVEPHVRLRYRDVVPQAGFDTSLTARWGYRPLAVRDFAFQTGRLFHPPTGAQAFGADGAVTARSNEQRYAQAHGLMRKVLGMAHARGIQVAIGFEFGVHPPEFASVVPPQSRLSGTLLPDPTHPANIEILQSALDDILREYPGLDWIWLWLHEYSMSVGRPALAGRFADVYNREKANFADAPDEHDVFTGVWALTQIRQVRDHLSKRSPQTKLVIGGWGGGPQLPPVLRGLDRALPADIVFSCLNPDMGSRGPAPVLDEIARRRPVWSMPWLEGDAWLWHLQLRAQSVLEQVRAARAARHSGVVAIHWRTEEIRPNLEAFALAADSAADAPGPEEFYRRHCARRYGPAAAGELAPLLLSLERDQQLGSLDSPEYYPYDPSWGRVPPALAERLRDAIASIDRFKKTTPSARHRDNLGWLADNFRFTLLLDEFGRKIEPAYALKESYLLGQSTAGAAEARRAFAAAPVAELFRTFARRVRSRGELGELSALNQKLWLEYRELDRFLAGADVGGASPQRPPARRR